MNTKDITELTNAIDILTADMINKIENCEDECKCDNHSSKHIETYLYGYNFSEDLPNLEVCIEIIQNTYYKKGNIFINIQTEIDNIYESDNNDDECYQTLLHIGSSEIENIDKNDSLEKKIKTVLNYIYTLSTKYEYSKYFDFLIEKDKLEHKFLISQAKNILCHKEVNECVVCYDKINSSSLKTKCCKKYICRVCTSKLKPRKCPNCRHCFCNSEDCEDCTE